MEYEWQRRWLLRDAGADSQPGASGNERRALALWELQAYGEGKTLSELRDVPCLVLLGEPGMGKTYAVQWAKRELEATVDGQDAQVVLLDLLGSGSPEEVRERIVGGDKFRHWKNGNHLLVMFIDNLDQAALPVDEVISVISNELEDCDLTRLKLRLVCRDADWSDTLSDRLSRHTFEKDAALRVQTYHLLPLNDDEIRLAATKSGKSGDEFLQQLSDAQATPLARIPITLQMLLNADTLTVDRAKLFKSGLLQLCKATRSESKNSRRRVAMRLSAAAKIAGVMKLCDRYSIDIDGSATLNANSITVSELLRCLHDTMGELDEDVIHETLNSALFAGSGQRRWAHQSYADFLAASFLQEHTVPPNRMLEWTTGSDGKFAPQLRETLRWLCELDGTFVRNVAKRDMELLLASDLSHLSKRMYKQFIRQLLDGADDYEYAMMSDAFRNMRAGHPDASAVLRPYLVDTELGNQKRVLVLRILDSVPTVEIEDSMLDIVLNKCEPQILRNRSARRLVKEGSKSVKLKLKRFVGSQEDDEDDQLKGYALQALWPEHITVDELFDALEPPKRENYFGSYALFISELKRSEFMNLDVIPAALEWVARQPRRHDMPFFFPDIMDIAMRAAWQYRHLPSVLESFAQAVVARLKHHDGIIGKKHYSSPPDQDHDAFIRAFADDSEGRRELALLCLKLISDHDNAAALLRLSQPPLVTSEDTDWLVGLLDAGVDVDLRSHVCLMVARTTFDEPAKVYEASERHPDLDILTKRRFFSAFDDPEVVSRRQYFLEDKQWEKDIALRQARFKPLEQLEEAIAKIEAGDVNHWLTLIYYLLVEVTGAGSVEFRPDMTEFPNWNLCDQELQARIVTAARKYILQFEYKPSGAPEENWYASGTILHAELAGYYALFLLRNLSPAHFTDIPVARWRKWSSIVVWFPLEPLILNDGRREYHERTRTRQLELIRMLCQKVPERFLDDFRHLLIANDGQDHHIGQDLDKFAHLWDNRLESMLLALLREEALSPKGQRSLLDFLLRHGCEDASNYADDRILDNVFATSDRDRIVELCVAQMLSASDFDWSAIWHVFLSDEEMGKEIVERVANEDYHRESMRSLHEQELADLFLWTEKRYPTSEDPQIEGFHAVSVREQVGNWRNRLIHRLSNKGSEEALNQIKTIIDRYPDLEWIQFIRVGVQANVDRGGWTPAEPNEILRLESPEPGRGERGAKAIWAFFKRHWKWILGFLGVSEAVRNWVR